MAQKFVGVDLGTHHVKVSVLTAGLRGVQLVDVYEVEVVHDEEAGSEVDPLSHAVTAAIATLRSKGLIGEPTGLCVPAGLLSFRVLSFPFTDERRIAQTVAFEADGQFPVPLEQLDFGHLAITAPDGGGRALVVAAKKDRLEALAHVFKRAGVDLKVMTSGAIAAAQVTGNTPPPVTPESAEQGLQPVTLLIDLGHQHTQFVACGPKGPLAVRTLRRGGRQLTQTIANAYNLDFAAAEAAKHGDAFLPHRGYEQISAEQLKAGKVIATAFEPILRELEHTRLWLRATYRLEVGKLVLLGGGAGLNGIEAYLSEQTGLPTEPSTIGAAGLRAMESRSWTTAIGSLGAAYGAARRPLVQLRDVDEGSGEGSWLQERMSGLVALGVAVLAFGALDTIARVKAAESELAAYQSELEEATRKTFGSPHSPADVKTKLDAVEGADLTSLIPERGALEVLALITKAATPSDLSQAAPGVAVGAGAIGLDPAAGGPPLPGAPPLAGGGALLGEDDEGEDEGGAAPPAAVQPTGPIAATAGIVMSDDLAFRKVDIRELKIDLEAVSNSSSSQDRLIFKLQQTGCLTNIAPGKVRGDTRKSFEMSMDNNCYYKSAQVEEDDAEGESEPDSEFEEQEG